MPNDDISRAVVLFIGKGEEKFPRARVDKVVEAFGEERAGALTAEIGELSREIESSPTPSAGLDSGEAYRAVRDGFRATHPTLSEEAVAALAWKWSWDNR